jgi:hypothetical protein
MSHSQTAVQSQPLSSFTLDDWVSAFTDFHPVADGNIMNALDTAYVIHSDDTISFSSNKLDFRMSKDELISEVRKLVWKENEPNIEWNDTEEIQKKADEHLIWHMNWYFGK